MIAYACVLPHSPTLLKELTQTQPALVKKSKTDEAFERVRQEILSRKIKQLMILSAHPRYLRQGISLNAAPSYEASFTEFGNLTMKDRYEMSWKLYHHLRQSLLSFPPQIIDQTPLDYGCSIPLHLLNLQKEAGFEFLCLNDDDNASLADRQRFAQGFAEALKSFAEPVAVLCSGDLHSAKTNLEEAQVKQDNKQARTQIRRYLSKESDAASLAFQTCLTGPLQLLQPLTPHAWKYRELSFEEQNRSSFLVADFETA